MDSCGWTFEFLCDGSRRLVFIIEAMIWPFSKSLRVVLTILGLELIFFRGEGVGGGEDIFQTRMQNDEDFCPCTVPEKEVFRLVPQLGGTGARSIEFCQDDT